MKLKCFCRAKKTINKTKRQPSKWEKIFANHVSDKGLVSRTYKVLAKLDSNKRNNPIRNWAKDISPKWMCIDGK